MQNYHEAIAAIKSALSLEPENMEYKRILADLEAKIAIE
jgi:hypothetical protein